MEDSEESQKTAKKRKCSYNKDWETHYPWVKPVKDESDRAFCELCQSVFSVKSGGEYDVKRHKQCETHKKCAIQREASHSMDTFLLKPQQDNRQGNSC